MQIDKELLSEKNYTGSRRIMISNQMVTKFKKEIDELQKQANPILKKMEKISESIKPEMEEIGELQKKIREIKEKIKPEEDKYQTELKKVELIDQKADNIKNKIYPIVFKELEGKLEEFEEARQVITDKGVVYVEIHDKIEDFIKMLRANKIK